MIKSKSQKTNKNKSPKVIENFKAVEWTRKIRDKMYEENQKTNIHQYVKKILS